ncbi:MAG: ATP-binding protein [Thermoplasmata archaeon]|nr:ATP-binding protein [Thermoplasmata archaeon]
MIPRTIQSVIESSITYYPVTLVTGARQVGKTTLCLHIAEKYGFDYVSLTDASMRALAQRDPDFFLRSFTKPLIIDEVQHAPNLFDHLEAAVDRRKAESGDNKGMYILTGSQAFNLMKGVTESMAGRISVIEMSPLSLSETMERGDAPFTADPEESMRRCRDTGLSQEDLYRMAVRGLYPALYESPGLPHNMFYSNYVSTYIDRDVAEMVDLRDKNLFLDFMETMASYTGQELVYDHVSNLVGVDVKTVQRWTSILVTGGIIRLIRPYVERSNIKRLAKRPKIYFCDTGLACHLCRCLDADSLKASYLRGPIMETFIVNEIIKSYGNTSTPAAFYYFRDSNGNEVDLIIQRNGMIHLVECKSGVRYDSGDVKAFSRLDNSEYVRGPSCIVCLTETPYPISEGVWALPLSSI